MVMALFANCILLHCRDRIGVTNGGYPVGDDGAGTPFISASIAFWIAGVCAGCAASKFKVAGLAGVILDLVFDILGCPDPGANGFWKRPRLSSTTLGVVFHFFTGFR